MLSSDFEVQKQALFSIGFHVGLNDHKIDIMVNSMTWQPCMVSSHDYPDSNYGYPRLLRKLTVWHRPCEREMGIHGKNMPSSKWSEMEMHLHPFFFFFSTRMILHRVGTDHPCLSMRDSKKKNRSPQKNRPELDMIQPRHETLASISGCNDLARRRDPQIQTRKDDLEWEASCRFIGICPPHAILELENTHTIHEKQINLSWESRESTTHD